MDTMFLNRPISRQEILDVLERFDRQYPSTESYDNHWLQKKTYKYVLLHAGRLYPPKQILSMAIGVPTTDFGGGEQTNRVFCQLGFEIQDK